MSGAIYVVYNSSWSKAEDQQLLHSLLPVSHEYGDRSALLKTGVIINGRQEHDAYVSPELRVRTRKRCTLAHVTATHMGSAASRILLPGPMNVLTCFCAIPDWHASGLDAEAHFLRPVDTQMVFPRIGPYSFNFTNFIGSMYEDLMMSLMSVRNMFVDSEGQLIVQRKAHVKIVPLGVGPSIKTRYGEFLGPLLIPCYLIALQFACNSMIDETWVDTLEFVDHTYGQLSPNLSIRRIKIMSGVSRDAFDFTNASGFPVIIAPCDSFSKIGGSPHEKTLATTIANNSNLRELLETSPYKFVAWPN
jgi:hypothetical protein